MLRNSLGNYENATGFILDWMIAGFFPNGTQCDHEPDLYEPKRSRYWKRDYLKSIGGEAAVRDVPPRGGMCAVEWLALRGEAWRPKIWLQAYLRAYPELAAAFPGEANWDHQWYALAIIESDMEQAAELRVCGHDGCRVWWNGQFVFEEHSWHKLVYDLDVIAVLLKKGRNSLLLKLDRYGLVARVTGVGGKKLKGKVALGSEPPRARPPGTFEQLARYSRTLKVIMPCEAETAGEYRRWREGALGHFRKCMGEFPRMEAARPRLAFSPSPGTPGEGWGEGSRAQSADRRGVSIASNPHPGPLSEYREREKLAAAPTPTAVARSARPKSEGRTARAPAVLVEQVARDGYTRSRYHLLREAGTILPAYVLVPDASRFNGRTVICPHGHGQDDKVVAGVQPPARPYNNWCGTFTGNYAELLAQAGFVTATWSERAMSHERNDSLAREDPCNVAGLCALAMGMTLPGLHLFDLHGVADFVATLPGVDANRMGLTGLSGGGTMSYLGGAYDERFAAVAIFCGMLSYAEYAAEGACGQQVVPGLYPTLDVGQLLCLIAPRPLLLGQGRRDVLFNTFLLRRYAREARRAYRALGHQGRLGLCIYDLAHQVNIEAAIEFFTRNL